MILRSPIARSISAGESSFTENGSASGILGYSRPAGACQAGPVRPSARGRRLAFQVITQGRHPVAVGQAAPAAGLLSEMERWKEPEPKPESDQIIDKLRGCGMLRENSSSAQRQLVQREYCPLNRRRPTFFALHYNG